MRNKKANRIIGAVLILAAMVLAIMISFVACDKPVPSVETNIPVSTDNPSMVAGGGENQDSFVEGGDETPS